MSKTGDEQPADLGTLVTDLFQAQTAAIQQQAGDKSGRRGTEGQRVHRVTHFRHAENPRTKDQEALDTLAEMLNSNLNVAEIVTAVYNDRGTILIANNKGGGDYGIINVAKSFETIMNSTSEITALAAAEDNLASPALKREKLSIAALSRRILSQKHGLSPSEQQQQEIIDFSNAFDSNDLTKIQEFVSRFQDDLTEKDKKRLIEYVKDLEQHKQNIDKVKDYLSHHPPQRSNPRFQFVTSPSVGASRSFRGGSGDVHAEMKIINYLKSKALKAQERETVTSKALKAQESKTDKSKASKAQESETEGEKQKQLGGYIGVSKLCCAMCRETIEVVNKTKGSQFETSGTHAKFYPCGIPEFVTSDPKIKSTLVGRLSHLKAQTPQHRAGSDARTPTSTQDRSREEKREHSKGKSSGSSSSSPEREKTTPHKKVRVVRFHTSGSFSSSEGEKTGVSERRDRDSPPPSSSRREKTGASERRGHDSRPLLPPPPSPPSSSRREKTGASERRGHDSRPPPPPPSPPSSSRRRATSHQTSRDRGGEKRNRDQSPISPALATKAGAIGRSMSPSPASRSPSSDRTSSSDETTSRRINETQGRQAARKSNVKRGGGRSLF